MIAAAFVPLTCTPQTPPEILVSPITSTRTLFETVAASCMAVTPVPEEVSAICTLLMDRKQFPAPHRGSSVSAKTPVPRIFLSEPLTSFTELLLQQFAASMPTLQLPSPSIVLSIKLIFPFPSTVRAYNPMMVLSDGA